MAKFCLEPGLGNAQLCLLKIVIIQSRHNKPEVGSCVLRRWSGPSMGPGSGCFDWLNPWNKGIFDRVASEALS